MANSVNRIPLKKQHYVHTACNLTNKVEIKTKDTATPGGRHARPHVQANALGAVHGIHPQQVGGQSSLMGLSGSEAG
eukprot:1151410-Pelagomonas_calceolata.AAC.1